MTIQEIDNIINALESAQKTIQAQENIIRVQKEYIEFLKKLPMTITVPVPVTQFIPFPY